MSPSASSAPASVGPPSQSTSSRPQPRQRLERAAQAALPHFDELRAAGLQQPARGRGCLLGDHDRARLARRRQQLGLAGQLAVVRETTRAGSRPSARRTVSSGSSRRTVPAPTITASARARSSCTARRLSRQLIQRASPPPAATLPSSVTAALYVTSGRPVAVVLQEGRVLLAGARREALLGELHLHAGVAQPLQPASVDQGVGVAQRHHGTRDARPPRSRPRRAASGPGGCTARACSRGSRRGRPRRPRPARRPRRAARRSAVPAAADHGPVSDEHGADQRIGVRAAPARSASSKASLMYCSSSIQKAPEHALQGRRRRDAVPASFIRTLTVGPGISPGRPLAGFAGCTAGGDFHPALKQRFGLALRIIRRSRQPAPLP